VGARTKREKKEATRGGKRTAPSSGVDFSLQESKLKGDQNGRTTISGEKKAGAGYERHVTGGKNSNKHNDEWHQKNLKMNRSRNLQGRKKQKEERADSPVGEKKKKGAVGTVVEKGVS